MDRLLYAIQRSLFPSVYGGSGLLHRMLRSVMHRVEDLKGFFFRAPATTTALEAAATPPPADSDAPTADDAAPTESDDGEERQP